MPVDDHPIHPSTQKGADFRYGCWNHKPFTDGYYAKDRIYRGNGTFYEVLTYIKHAMTKDCRFDMALTDPSCADCQHINMEVQDVRNKKV
jgi:hypothetical protein